MNAELKQKIEELLLLAKSQGVSIIGVVDAQEAMIVVFLNLSK
ncbi:hypothetical protein JCM19240_3595 [Vibrio maritimus]|uniref:Uncharacterized protein n=1 Tax=Vibrio maritimus TaxID=990268 RepID=A0A090T5G7_9VIBR|nr:hypothetical protein JCM19240_3595 [Vibrio maritimus]